MRPDRPEVILYRVSERLPSSIDHGVRPRFGRSMLAHWLLDPDITYLNHGTVGAPPRPVLAAQAAIREEIERQPSRFLLRELADFGVGMPRRDPSRLRLAARAVAPFFGAREEDLVLVDNATTGVNAVLRSLPLRAGDEILVTDHAYGAIRRTAEYVARGPGARVRVVELAHPPEATAGLVGRVLAGLGKRTRVAVIDHVTSESAWVLPVAEIASGCRRRGVPVLVDGAHGPGAMPLDVPALGVDWYSGNLHKWAFAPRPSGFLWATPARQEGLHPPVISWGLDQGFTAEFDRGSTRDPSALLAAPEGISFLRELGEQAVWRYNHALAWEAAKVLGRRWGRDAGVPEGMIGSMATIPLPGRSGSTLEDAARLRDALLFEDRIEVQLHAWRDRLWARVSAQVYNEIGDVERLADAVLSRC